MVGWNYDLDKSQRMTPDEREALRTLGGLTIVGGLGYLWLTRDRPIAPSPNLKVYDAGAFQERGTSFTISRYEVKETAEQTLTGFVLGEDIEIFAVHNGEGLTANIQATFNDGSTHSITKNESKQTSTQYSNTGQEYAEGVVTASINLEPNVDFEQQIIDGKSISKYTVVLNVSGKGLKTAIRFTIGA